MSFKTPLITESVHQQGAQLVYAALYFAHLFLLIWPQVCSLVLWNLGQHCFIKPCGLRHLPPARRMILEAFQITILVVIFSVLWTNTLLAWSLPQFQGNVGVYLHSVLERGSPLCSFSRTRFSTWLGPRAWIHAQSWWRPGRPERPAPCATHSLVQAPLLILLCTFWLQTQDLPESTSWCFLISDPIVTMTTVASNPKLMASPGISMNTHLWPSSQLLLLKLLKLLKWMQITCQFSIFLYYFLYYISFIITNVVGEIRASRQTVTRTAG